MFFLVLSVAFFLGSPLMTLGIVLALLVYLRATVASEERRLASRQGDAFSQYCQRVPRFWPRWGLYHAGEKLEVDLRSLRLEVFRAVRWCAIPLACEVVRIVIRQPDWPRLF